MTTETMAPPTPKYKIGDSFVSNTSKVIWKIVDTKIVEKLSLNPISNKMEKSLVVKYEFAANEMLNIKVEETDIDENNWYLNK